jgi:uncharacterized protein (DUF433 family)
MRFGATTRWYCQTPIVLRWRHDVFGPAVKGVMETITQQAIGYPYITADSRILSGVPIVEGTRTPVRSIAGYFNMGMSVDEIMLALPYLSFSQVFSALTYYFDHKAEIDFDIARNNDVNHWEAMANAASRPH